MNPYWPLIAYTHVCSYEKTLGWNSRSTVLPMAHILVFEGSYVRTPRSACGVVQFKFPEGKE